MGVYTQDLIKSQAGVYARVAEVNIAIGQDQEGKTGGVVTMAPGKWTWKRRLLDWNFDFILDSNRNQIQTPLNPIVNMITYKYEPDP